LGEREVPIGKRALHVRTKGDNKNETPAKQRREERHKAEKRKATKRSHKEMRKLCESLAKRIKSSQIDIHKCN